MNESDLLSALQACATPTVTDRHCELCPLHTEHDCHVALCELTIDYILRNRSKVERLHNDVNHLQTTLDAISSSLRGA